MRLAYEYPEGGVLIVPVGEQGGLPECFFARRPAVADRPEVSFTVRVRDGQAGCYCVCIETPEDKPISATELSALRLPDLLDQAIKDNLYERVGDDAWTPRFNKQVLTEAVGSIHNRRNKLTPDLLTLVAEIFDEGGARLVAERLGKSRSQAHRLVNHAKARQQ